MKLYIGGVFQGQEELAREENPHAEIFSSFHETIREVLNQNQDARAFAEELCQNHPEAVVVSDEVGAGIVPIDHRERAFREGVGRALCTIAKNSDEVVRCVCGIRMQLK